MAIAAGLCAACSGCVLVQANRSNQILASLRELRGSVLGPWPPGTAAYAVVYRRTNDAWAVTSHRTLHRPGAVEFLFWPGDYLLFAYLDENGNQAWDPGEPAARSGPHHLQTSGPLPGIELALVRGVTPPVPVVALADAPTVTQELVAIHRGDLARLDDPRFSLDNSALGFWHFADFAMKFGLGVSFLEPYDGKRTPVLFVHGAASTPRLMSRMIAGLDPARYQAWVYSYPSGAPLDMLGFTLSRILCDLQAKHHFSELKVVAHSMGGLVARDAINRLQRSEPEQLVTLLITLSTPFGGVESSRTGVRHSPVVLPCWRDLVPRSPFLTGLLTTPLPASMRHHLLFAYEGGGNSRQHTDGTVSIESQLPATLQAQAAGMRGFHADHDSILEDDGAVAEVLRILDLK